MPVTTTARGRPPSCSPPIERPLAGDERLADLRAGRRDRAEHVLRVGSREGRGVVERHPRGHRVVVVTVVPALGSGPRSPRRRAARGCRRAPGTRRPQLRWTSHLRVALAASGSAASARVARRAARGSPAVAGRARCGPLTATPLHGSARAPRRAAAPSSPSSRASTFSRSSGSVLLGRTLNHQSSPATVRPSSSSTVDTRTRPPSCSAIAAVRRRLVGDRRVDLTARRVAVVAAQQLRTAARRPAPSAASTCRAASMPESARQKSRK